MALPYSVLGGYLAYLYTKTNNVLLNLESEEGEFYTLLFDYQPFDSGPMYYREAIILLSTKGTRYLPLLSKAIITRNEVPQKNNEYLLGLLSLNTNFFNATIEDLQQMAKEINIKVKLNDENNTNDVNNNSNKNSDNDSDENTNDNTDKESDKNSDKGTDKYEITDNNEVKIVNNVVIKK